MSAARRAAWDVVARTGRPFPTEPPSLRLPARGLACPATGLRRSCRRVAATPEPVTWGSGNLTAEVGGAGITGGSKTVRLVSTVDRRRMLT